MSIVAAKPREYKLTTPDALTASEAQEWRAIVNDNEIYRSAFFTPTFAVACENSGRKISVLIISEGGQNICFFPFEHKRYFQDSLGWVTRLGGVMADYFGPIVRSGANISVQEILAHAGINYLLFDHMKELNISGGALAAQHGNSPIVSVEDGFDAYLEHISELRPGRVKDLFRCRRKLEREAGVISIRFEDDMSEENIDRILNAKRAQYRDTDVSDLFMESKNRNLISVLGKQRGDQTCRLIITNMFAGDRWVAGHIGLAHSDTLHYWFPVYDTDFRPTSPGRILIFEMLKLANQHGFNKLDFGFGDAGYKLEFATTLEPLYKGIWKQENIYGEVSHFLQRVDWRVKSHFNLDRQQAYEKKEK